ncbi:hypothetical protein O9G_003500 [Rozella allomycis CSF55]|uniref:Ion transport domain-containing protein n=1 Tax=Rozella allomycis (strain CSF55) TaxID=988480 RepID=A0A075B2X8_ROZAC|nr:hypothetical protein O9G_003500 [Rozella allomycis CSF55]|eukprot:EPZ35128.1 hypothetical protein O9G_003500 [Rozella allomycis CSF55]
MSRSFKSHKPSGYQSTNFSSDEEFFGSSMSYSGLETGDEMKSMSSDNNSVISAFSQTSTTGKMEKDERIELETRMNQAHPLQRNLWRVTEIIKLDSIIMVVIVINTIMTALEATSAMYTLSFYLTILDNFLLGIYLTEMLVKMIIFDYRYFKSAWNIFDFIIVVSSLVSLFIPSIVSNSRMINTDFFRFLRLFRALRALRSLKSLRSIKFIQSLSMVLKTLFRSLPAIGNIVFLALIVFCIFIR